MHIIVNNLDRVVRDIVFEEAYVYTACIGYQHVGPLHLLYQFCLKREHLLMLPGGFAHLRTVCVAMYVHCQASQGFST